VSSISALPEPFIDATQFEQLRGIVEAEFDVEDGFMEYGIPTFYVRLREDSKQAFLRLIKKLEDLELVPLLRRKEEKVVLKIVRKLPVKPSRKIINLALFFATVGTTFVTGYILSLGWVREGLMSEPMVGAVMFTAAIMGILVAHEMGHKFTADRHGVEATMPYFIPGPPPNMGGFGTFGAVIQQKSLPPNRDALFDLGASGPIIGFIATIIVTVIGAPLSHITTVEPGAPLLPSPMLTTLIFFLFPPSGTSGNAVLLHPVAFAGWIGMIITMLNLVPAGMLDGGHATRGLFKEQTCRILSFFAVVVLFLFGYFLMAMFALFLSMQRHPAPLDDVSKVTTSRKLVTIVLILIFVLSLAPIWPIL
jgi:membrane-associated protease RseP (regulator of RpoE activity)